MLSFKIHLIFRKGTGSVAKGDMPNYRRPKYPTLGQPGSTADYVYRETMSRLKRMLDDYSSPKPHFHAPRFDIGAPLNRPRLSDIYASPLASVSATYEPNTSIAHVSEIPITTCKYEPSYLRSTRSTLDPPISANSSDPVAKIEANRLKTECEDLKRFIQRQEDYIKKLETENASYREELANLKYKVDELSGENDSLVRQVDRLQETVEQEEREYTSRMSLRVTDLETQLSHEKTDAKRLREENSQLRHKIATGDGIDQVDRLKRKIEDLMQDNSELQMKLRRLQDEKSFGNYATIRASSSINDLYGGKDFSKGQLEVENRRLQVRIVFHYFRSCKLTNFDCNRMNLNIKRNVSPSLKKKCLVG